MGVIAPWAAAESKGQFADNSEALILRFGPRKRKAPKRGGRNRLRKVYFEAGGICQLCGEYVPMAQASVDRIIPGAHGGAYVPGNVQLACIPCNGRKGARIVPRFAFRRVRDDKIS